MLRSREWRSSSSGVGCSRNGSSRPSGSASSSARSSARELAPVSPSASSSARFEQQRLYLPAWILDRRSAREDRRQRRRRALRIVLGESQRGLDDPHLARCAHVLVHVVEGSLHEVGLAYVHQDLQRARLRRRREDVSRREPPLDALSGALAVIAASCGRARIPARPVPRTASSPSSVRRSAAGRARRGPATPLPRRAARATGPRCRARRRRSRRTTPSPPTRALAPARSPPWPAAPRSPQSE